MDKTKRVHIVGIGGAGMSAIAVVLNRKGFIISGSDLKSSHVTDRLSASGIEVNIPHDSQNIDESISQLVISSAIGDDNVEVLKAKELSIPVLSRAEMLAEICRSEKTLGIAGSHGKTTTTSMVTAIARAGDLNPSFMIGGDLNEIGTNAIYNKGSVLIVEADESDRTFLDLDLKGAIITNIENDHLESYNDSFEVLQASFLDFIKNVDGPVVVCIDEPNSANVVEKLKDTRDVITVGASNANFTYEIENANRGGITAQVTCPDNSVVLLELAVPGLHNIKNALCALALMNTFGVSIEDCLKGLASFGGVARRFQFRGQTRGITFVDDYAHLPSEISATLAAARDGEFKNIVVVFQPHRYSRTQALYKEFAQSLLEGDKVAVCDIYSAGEEPRQGITGNLIAEEMRKLGKGDVAFVRHIDEVIKFVDENAGAGDIVLTLGAGDVTMYSDVIQKTFNEINGSPLRSKV